MSIYICIKRMRSWVRIQRIKYLEHDHAASLYDAMPFVPHTVKYVIDDEDGQSALLMMIWDDELDLRTYVLYVGTIRHGSIPMQPSHAILVNCLSDQTRI